MTVYVLTLGDGRHGNSPWRCFGDEMTARRAVKGAFQEWAKNMGGSAKFEPITDSNMWLGENGSVVIMYTMEVL